MRRLLLRLVTPLVWRIPGHGARKLYSFAKAEQGSRIDLMQAAQLTTSLARRALYLRHALDETRHASMFWRRANELRSAVNDSPLSPPVADTERLFERLGEQRFLAFVHRGEKHGREQFELYAKHFQQRADARTQSLFEAILVDEHRHETYTHSLLVEVSGGETAARKELRRAAWWQAWRTWRRAGRFVAHLIYVAMMTLVYFVFAPFVALAHLISKPRSNWHLASPLTVSDATTQKAKGG
jgi:rubrerythrin